MMKVVQFHRTALSRQVGESIRIQKRGGMGGLVLNSKSEYNRCSIARLCLEQKEEFKEAEEDHMTADGDDCEDLDWTTGLLEKRDLQDRENRRSLGKLVRIGSEKRKDSVEFTGRKRSKRKKYENISEDWGMCEGEGRASENFLYSGLEGVKLTKAVDNHHGEKKNKKKGKKAQAQESIAESNRKITDWTRSGAESIL